MFESLDIEMEEDLMDYLIYVVYSKSESVDKMAYGLIFEVVEGKVVPGHLSQSSDN